MLRWLLTVFILSACTTQSFEKNNSCVIVDTDSSFDDVRAISWLLKKDHVDYLIFTEGITLPSNGALLLKQFFKDSNIPVNRWPKFIMGNSTHRIITERWQTIRHRDERLNNYYTSLPKPDGSIKFDKISDISKQCLSIQLYILGPTTSAQQYLKEMTLNIQTISFMGRLDKNDFNCWYDFDSCQKLLSSTRYRINKVYIPQKDATNQFYGYTKEDVDKLSHSGMSGILKKAFLATPAAWLNGSQLMWDDITVMLHYYPQWYSPQNDYLIPAENARKYKDTWINTLNN